MSEKEAREACIKAAEYISQHGWHQGELFAEGEGNAPACALGALHAVTNWESSVVFEASDLLAAHVGVPPMYVALHWNDQPERTAEDVILALKRVGSGE